MKIIAELNELRATLKTLRKTGSIAFVPTMGNLHAGHLSLVKVARQRADHVVASIFVNPMQFGAGEDLDNYPRTFESDCEGLEKEGTDLLFAPNVDNIYARPEEQHTRVEVPQLSSILCGDSRPTHFVGVSTVVCKLFNMVQPDIAVFGQKDYQQLMIIRRMTEDLNIPVEILGVPTMRETDGLAMSSRNGYLTAEERLVAPNLYKVLSRLVERLREGERDYARLEQDGARTLDEAGLRPDYLKILRAVDLGSAAGDETHFAILGAAYLGKARLIDNIELQLT